VQPQDPERRDEPDTQNSGARNGGRRAGGIGAAAATLAAIAIKFKAILFVVLQLWSPLLTFWLYAVAFGWRFGLVFVLLILAHELGHYFAFRAYGLPVRLPVFVPFFGAFTAGAVPKDPEHAAYIALAGPLVGFGLAAACYAAGAAFHDRFWLAIASVGAFLNLFNMIPVVPFDGGRVVASAKAVPGQGRFAALGWYAATAVGLIVVTWQSYATQAHTNVW
jgi:Zn-dependent protease